MKIWTQHARNVLFCTALWAMACVAQAAGQGAWQEAQTAADAALGQGRYVEAERLFRAAIAIAETHGESLDHLCKSLVKLAETCQRTRKLDESEKALLRAVGIQESLNGQRDIGLCQPLMFLSDVYYERRQFLQAEEAAKRALGIAQQGYGQNDPKIRPALVRLSNAYRAQGKYDAAEKQLLRAISIEPNNAGDWGECEFALALVYRDEGREDRAEMALKSAIRKAEKRDRVDSMLTPYLIELGRSCAAQGKHDDAERHFKKAVESEQRDQFIHDTLAREVLADYYLERKNYAAAEPLLKNLVTLAQEQNPRSGRTALLSSRLARVYYATKRYKEAEPLYKMAATFLPPNCEESLNAIEGYVKILQETGQQREAQLWMGRADIVRKRIRAKAPTSRPAASSVSPESIGR